MDKFLITEEDQKLYRRFLNKQDFIKIASHTGYKISTVSDIVKRVRPVNEETLLVVQALNIYCYGRMNEMKTLITKSLKQLRKLPEVRIHNNLKDSDKWI